MDRYKILYRGGTGELEEKKSRFIANLRPVRTQEEAIAFIEEIRRQHWDARHNCYAYLIGRQNEIQRYSDDGEPSQTAGRPMMDMLAGEGIHDACAVVTRYFGGTLLGTGGLVRAYSGAVRRALEHCLVVERCQGRKVKVETDYNGLGKIQHLAGQMGYGILDTSYAEHVTMELLVAEDEVEMAVRKLAEVTNGKGCVDDGERAWYASVDGRTVVLDC